VRLRPPPEQDRTARWFEGFLLLRRPGGEDLGGEVARKLLGDLAYRSGELKEKVAELGIVLLTNEASARRTGVKQQIEPTLLGLIRPCFRKTTRLLLVWPVDKSKGAKTESCAFDKPQLRRRRPVREKPPSPAHDEGLD
jgi:hypothetical protein